MRRQQTNPGFTLIELLVVVAIIALLVSILLPSLNQAKELTKQVICQSNLRQQSLAFRMYAGENKDAIPRHAYDPLIPPQIYWYHALSPYCSTWTRTQNAAGEWTTNPGVFRCPSDTTQFGADPGAPADRSSYGLSGSIFEDSTYGQRFTNIPEPDTTGMVMDAVYLAFYPFHPNPDATVQARAEPNHNEGVNVLFADLHIKWMSKIDLTEEMFTPDPND